MLNRSPISSSPFFVPTDSLQPQTQVMSNIFFSYSVPLKRNDRFHNSTGIHTGFFFAGSGGVGGGGTQFPSV